MISKSSYNDVMKTWKKVVSVFMISLVILFSGVPLRIGDFEFTPGVEKADAATGTIRPNGDSTPLQWTSTGSNHYGEIDEVVTQPTAGTTTDNINNGGSATNVDQIAMDNTITGIGSATAVTVWIYAVCTKSNSAFSVDLYYNGSTQNLGSATIETSYGWYSVSFTSLTLTQAYLDGLEIVLTGDGGGRTYTVATMYADVTYTTGVSISITTDGTVPFGTLAANTTQDNSATGTNDIQTVSVDTGPSDLDIKASAFSDGGNSWTFASTTGADQVKYEFSKDNSAWTTFLIADNLYAFDTNVATSGTRSIYLRITTPTSSASYSQYSTTVTIVGSAP